MEKDNLGRAFRSYKKIFLTFVAKILKNNQLNRQNLVMRLIMNNLNLILKNLNLKNLLLKNMNNKYNKRREMI